jgi:hypothetical protein
MLSRFKLFGHVMVKKSINMSWNASLICACAKLMNLQAKKNGWTSGGVGGWIGESKQVREEGIRLGNRYWQHQWSAHICSTKSNFPAGTHTMILSHLVPCQIMKNGTQCKDMIFLKACAAGELQLSICEFAPI